MILNTFFLRYRADTGQAVKDVDKLDKANDKLDKSQKKTAKGTKDSTASIRDDLKKTGESAREVGDAFGQMSVTGGNAFAVLRSGASALVSVVGAIGPAGLVAAAGIGAVIAAISIANAGVEDARKGAEEAIALGEKAFDARLAQSELIRLQNAGRRRGLSDEQTNASAQGTYDRASEIRAAQRQAARDPASAFNNPLIKQAALWKKAGVDVAAATEKQVEQQNHYLRALQERGEGERALIEGTQLFGRTLADVKSVVSATNAEILGTALANAKDNEIRRKLQANAEALSTAETKLDAERKKTDERIRSQTVPATKDFTEALTEWHRATQPLQEAWGKFVADMIEGLAKIVRWSTKFLSTIGLADESTEGLPEREFADKKALDAAEAKMREDFALKHAPRIGLPATEADRADLEARIKAMREGKQAELDAANKAADQKRAAEAPANIKAAAEGLLSTKDGKRTFEGREVSDAEYAAAMKSVEEAIKNDPAADTLEEIRILLSDQLSKVKEQGKLAEAQTAYTKKIESNTAALINTGLEQALSLWAANVGKASGLATGAFVGETREHYEDRMRHLQRTVNPNTARQVSEARPMIEAARNTARQVDAQAEEVNKVDAANTFNTINNSNNSGRQVTFGDVNVKVSSASGTSAGQARELGVNFKDELTFAVNQFADPRVS